MVGAAVHGLHVNVGARTARKSLEEIRHQFGLQIADQARPHLGIHRKRRPPAQVHRGNRQRLVHRHQEISGAQNAAFISQSAIECFAQRDPHVLDSVVLIHIEIAIAL